MKKILVIEDDASLRRGITELLVGAGYDVWSAEDGQIGLHQTQQEDFDLIISDINMPKLTGLDVLSKLRSDPSTQHIPFIFLTARSMNQDIRQGMSNGADDYLTKPFSPQELLDAVAVRTQKHDAIMRDVAQQEEQLQLLRQFDSELAYRFDADWAITIMMDYAIRATNAHVALFGTFAKSLNTSEVQFAQTPTEVKLRKGHIWYIGEDIREKINNSSSPVLLNKSRVDSNNGLIDLNAQSVLVLSITTPDKFIGIVFLESKMANAFTQDKVDFLLQIANRTAVILEQKFLLEEILQKQKDELRICNQWCGLETEFSDG